MSNWNAQLERQIFFAFHFLKKIILCTNSKTTFECHCFYHCFENEWLSSSFKNLSKLFYHFLFTTFYTKWDIVLLWKVAFIEFVKRNIVSTMTFQSRTIRNKEFITTICLTQELLIFANLYSFLKLALNAHKHGKSPFWPKTIRNMTEYYHISKLANKMIILYFYYDTLEWLF